MYVHWLAKVGNIVHESVDSMSVHIGALIAWFDISHYIGNDGQIFEYSAAAVQSQITSSEVRIWIGIANDFVLINCVHPRCAIVRYLDLFSCVEYFGVRFRCFAFLVGSVLLDACVDWLRFVDDDYFY